MSQACCTFNFEFPVPATVEGWVREVIELLENVTPGEELDNGDPIFEIFSGWNDWGELGFNLWFNPDTKQCGIDSDDTDYGNTENACSFLLAFLGECYAKSAEFNEVGFTYAAYGDGENGGGAIRCFLDGSKPEVEYITTDGWLSEAFAGKGN